MNEAASNADLATVDAVSGTEQDVTDELLAKAAGRGDDAAFEQIFERHRRRVTGMIGRFFNRPERVEEILQDVFTKVYFGLANYTEQPGASFAAWLSRVAINSCYDELRRARRRPESSISDITGDEIGWLNAQLRGESRSDFESEAISRDLANKLLSRLEADDQLVLILLDAEEMSVVEIGALLGWKVSKVKVRAHRARKSLRRVLGELL